MISSKLTSARLLPGEAVLCKCLKWRVYWWADSSHSTLLSGWSWWSRWSGETKSLPFGCSALPNCSTSDNTWHKWPREIWSPQPCGNLDRSTVPRQTAWDSVCPRHGLTLCQLQACPSMEALLSSNCVVDRQEFPIRFPLLCYLICFQEKEREKKNACGVQNTWEYTDVFKQVAFFTG